MTEVQDATGQTTWTLDPSHSVVEFSAKHMMIATVRGQFGTVAGTIVVDEANPERSVAEVEIDVAGIDTRAAERDAHLRSADFLDVENHPTIHFRSKRLEGTWQEAGDRFRVVGDLTIRGTTREVTLDATYEGMGKDPWGGERVGFSADTKIDRRDYGLIWNVGLETGGVLVSHEIRIRLGLEAVKAS